MEGGVELPERCVPCRGGVALTRDDAREHSLLLTGWELAFPRLRREYRLKDFRRALAWVNRVGEIAEEQGHHPDVHLTDWNRVALELWTHAVDGLHVNDFVLAREIDLAWEGFASR